MKTIVYLCLSVWFAAFTTQPARAQQPVDRHSNNVFDKGTGQLSITYGAGRGLLLSNLNGIDLQAGYYVAHRLLIGVTGSLINEWASDWQLQPTFSAGPFVRYQFSATRLSPFVALAYQLGRPTVSPTVNQAVSISPGVNFALLPPLRLEASYRLLVLPPGDQFGYPQLGATFLFGLKR